MARSLDGLGGVLDGDCRWDSEPKGKKEGFWSYGVFLEKTPIPYQQAFIYPAVRGWEALGGLRDRTNWVPGYI